MRAKLDVGSYLVLESQCRSSIKYKVHAYSDLNAIRAQCIGCMTPQQGCCMYFSQEKQSLIYCTNSATQRPDLSQARGDERIFYLLHVIPTNHYNFANRNGKILVIITHSLESKYIINMISEHNLHKQVYCMKTHLALVFHTNFIMTKIFTYPIQAFLKLAINKLLF